MTFYRSSRIGERAHIAAHASRTSWLGLHCVPVNMCRSRLVPRALRFATDCSRTCVHTRVNAVATVVHANPYDRVTRRDVTRGRSTKSRKMPGRSSPHAHCPGTLNAPVCPGKQRATKTFAGMKSPPKGRFQNVNSPAGNRTPVSRVTGGDTDHYTTEDYMKAPLARVLRCRVAAEETRSAGGVREGRGVGRR